MNELQTSLETLVNNGSWKDAAIYGIIVFAAFTFVSALLRSGFIILLGLVGAFYIFSLQSPGGKVDLNAAAAGEIVTLLVQKSTCAANSISELTDIGQIVRNGDVLNIAKRCGLMP